MLELKKHPDGVEAWREYYSNLPEKCLPMPYKMAIADGKTKEEAEKTQAEYFEVYERAKAAPAVVELYFLEIYLGKTPGEAYLNWINNRKDWSYHEWQPQGDMKQEKDIKRGEGD